MAGKDYEIGYGKPPKEHQFKPGQSGNPKGRPRGTKNLATDLQEELEEKILITEAGVQIKTSKQRAMLKTLMARALKGDLRASDTIIKLIVGMLQMPESHEAEGPDVADLAILDAYRAKLLAELQDYGADDDEKDSNS